MIDVAFRLLAATAFAVVAVLATVICAPLLLAHVLAVGVWRLMGGRP